MIRVSSSEEYAKRRDAIVSDFRKLSATGCNPAAIEDARAKAIADLKALGFSTGDALDMLRPKHIPPGTRSVKYIDARDNKPPDDVGGLI